MIDAILLGAIQRRRETALEQLIEKYTAYVCVVIRNTVGESLTHEDIEETASDVFLALWENADRVEKLKPWLAATARNKAKNKLRELHDDLPLDDEISLTVMEDMESSLIANDEQRAVKAAILAMGEPDREIFLRHYYESQTVATIVAETGMTEAKVKHRLVRGRKKLRTILDRQEAYQL